MKVSVFVRKNSKKLIELAKTDGWVGRILVPLYIGETGAAQLPKYVEHVLLAAIKGEQLCSIHANHVATRYGAHMREHGNLRPAIRTLFYPSLGRPNSIKNRKGWDGIPLTLTEDLTGIDLKNQDTVTWLTKNCYLLNNKELPKLAGTL